MWQVQFPLSTILDWKSSKTFGWNAAKLCTLPQIMNHINFAGQSINCTNIVSMSEYVWSATPQSGNFCHFSQKGMTRLLIFFNKVSNVSKKRFKMLEKPLLTFNLKLHKWHKDSVQVFRAKNERLRSLSSATMAANCAADVLYVLSSQLFQNVHKDTFWIRVCLPVFVSVCLDACSKLSRRLKWMSSVQCVCEHLDTEQSEALKRWSPVTSKQAVPV